MANSQDITLRIKGLLDTSGIKSSVNNIQSELSKLSLPKGMENSFTGIFKNLSTEISNFENSLQKGVGGKTDFSKLEKSANHILNLYDDLQNKVKNLTGMSGKDLEKLFPQQITTNIKNADNALNNYNKTSKSISDSVNKVQNDIQKANTDLTKFNQEKNNLNSKTQLNNTEWSNLSKSLKSAEKDVVDLKDKLETAKQTAANTAQTLNQPAKSSVYRQQVKDVQSLEQELQKAQQKVQNLQNQQSNSIKTSDYTAQMAKVDTNIANVQQKISGLLGDLNKLNGIDSTKAIDDLFNDLSKIQGIDLSNVPRTLQGAQQAIASFKGNQLAQVSQGLQNVKNAAQNSSGPFVSFKNAVSQARQENEKFTNQLKDMSAIKSKIAYFFSLTNGIQLFKRTVKEAFETVKTLDAAMTKTAVVTDFSVGDLWNQLPTYTQAANELGSSIEGVYEATTLFYQQGLNTEQAFSLGTEAIKMARIAGLDYEEATNRMTAALRGFNMELNEASAQRINDVYSRLAAITASDVNEISTAMDKTAALANSVGMSFETTAAFLAQGIETTRESADSIGTALKTVLARFTEVKEASSDLIDVDGEMVDVNKVDAALASVGIQLKNTKGEIRDMEDVFLELSAKWNTLDTMSQRYVATMAAGSRQQSRFIAMMSNYGRTMQLVEEANSSAGASQQQFEKTLDSMDTKLERLHNAWSEFTMGLANNQVLKGAVDKITDLVNSINRITESSSAAKGALSKIFVAFLGFKVGGTALSKMILPFISLGKEAANVFKSNFTNNFKNIKIPRKVFKQASQEIQQTVIEELNKIQKSGKQVNLFDFTKQFDQAAQNLGVSSQQLTSMIPGIYTEIENQIKQTAEYHNLSDEGREYVDSLIDGMIADLQSGRFDTVEQAIKQWMINVESGAKSKNLNIDTAKLIKVGPIDNKNLKVGQSSLAGITQAAGTAMFAVSELFNILGKKQQTPGIAAAKAAFTGLSTTLMVMPSLLQMVSTGMKALETASMSAGAAMNLAFGAVGIIATVATTIASSVSAAEEAKKAAEEAAQEEELKRADKTLEDAAAANEAYDSFYDLYKQYKETGQETEALQDATESLVKSLGIEKEYTRGLTKDYDDLIKKIKEARVEKAHDATKAAKKKADAEKSKFEAKNSSQGARGIISDENHVAKDVKELQQAILNSGLTVKTGDKTANNEDYFKFNVDTSNLEEVKKALKTLDDINAKYGGTETTYLEGYLDDYRNYLRQIQDFYESNENYKELLEAAENEISTKFDNQSFNIDNTKDAKTAYDSLVKTMKEVYDTNGILYTEDQLNAKATTILTEKIQDMDAASQNAARGFIKLNDMISSIKDNNGDTDWLTNGLNGKDGGKLQEYIDQLRESGELDLLLNFTVDPNNPPDNFEEFKEQMEGQSVNIKAKLITQNVDTIGGAVNELKINGNLSEMDEEKLTAFLATLENIKGIYNQNTTAAKEWETVSQQGLIAQMDYLTDLQQIQLGIVDSTDSLSAQEQAAAQQRNINANQEAEALRQQIDMLSTIIGLKGTMSNEELAAKFDIDVTAVEYADELVETLKGQLAEIDGQTIEIDFLSNLESFADNVVDRYEAIYEATKLIGEGYKVAAEDLQSLIDLMPELTEGATVVADGVIQLNADTVKSVLGGFSDMAKGDSDTVVAQLENQKAVLEARNDTIDEELKIINAANNAEVGANAEKNVAISENEDKALQNIFDNNKDAAKAVADANSSMASSYDQSNVAATDAADATGNITEGVSDADVNTGLATDSILKNAAAMGKGFYYAGMQASQIFAAFGMKTPGVVSYLDKIPGGKSSGGTARTGKDFTATYSQVQGTLRDFGSGLNSVIKSFTGKDLGINIDLQNGISTRNSRIDKNYDSSKKTYTYNGTVITLDDLKTTLENEQKANKADITKINNLILTVRSNQKKAEASIKNASSGKSGDLNNKGSGSGSNKDKGSSSDKKKTEYSKYEGDRQVAKEQALASMEEKSKDLADTYKDLAETEGTTVDDLIKNLQEQKSWLEKRVKAEKELTAARQQELAEAANRFKALGGVYTVDEYGNYYVDVEKTDKKMQSLVKGSDAEKAFQEALSDFENKSSAANSQQKDQKATEKELNALVKVDFKTQAENALKQGLFQATQDWLYNQQELVDDLSDKTSEVLDEYESLLEDEKASAAEIFQARQKYEAALNDQLVENATLLQSRYLEGSALQEAYADVSEYVTYDLDTLEIKLDDSYFDIQDEEIGKKVDDAVKAFEDNKKEIKNTEKELKDIGKDVSKLANEQRDDAIDLRNAVLDGMKAQLQEEIDALEKIDEDIEEQTSSLIDGMRKALERERQARDNEKKEQDIVDKETRLAYLKRDTTGGNAAEIAKLEKELAQEKEDYTDTLIDQKLSEMEDRLDEASEQRGKQIELLQQQLDELEDNPDWDQIEKIIDEGIGHDGKIKEGSELDEYLKAGTEYYKKSNVEKEKLDEERNVQARNELEYQSSQKQLEKLDNFGQLKGTNISFLDDQGKRHTGKVSDNGDVIEDLGDSEKTWQHVFSHNGEYITLEEQPKAVKKQQVNPTIPQSNTAGNGSSGGSSGTSTDQSKNPSSTPQTQEKIEYYKKYTGKSVSIVDALEAIGVDSSYKNRAKIAQLNGIAGYSGTPEQNTKLLNLLKQGKLIKSKTTVTVNNNSGSSSSGSGGNSGNSSGSGSSTTSYYKQYTGKSVSIVDALSSLGIDGSYNNRAKIAKANGITNYSGTPDQNTKLLNLLKQGKLKKYATGGLVTGTGLAWLDGTKSKPEYVLNAKQTEGFLKFTDILEGLMKNLKSVNTTNNTNNQTSNATFNITVKVDKMSSDYDVDQAVNRAKQAITTAAGYRNVNTINFRR